VGHATHQVLFSYGGAAGGVEELPLSAGTTIGASADYTNPAVGLDGSIFVRAPSNEAKRYLIADRSSTPNETYTVGAFGFTPVHRTTQRHASPRTVAFNNSNGSLGYFDELGDGTYYASTLIINGARGITWTGTDSGYGGADNTTGLISYKFDISAVSKTAVDSPGSNPLSFIQDLNPGANIYVARADGSAFLKIDTSDDSLDSIAAMSPSLQSPLLSCLIASDGFLYGIRDHSGTKKLERFSVSDGSVDAELSLGSPAVVDYLYESPADGCIWIRMTYLDSTVRMVGVGMSSMTVERYSESIPDGVSVLTPLGFTSTGLLALTGVDGGSLVYYTIDTA
jgi:hypothetical protein